MMHQLVEMFDNSGMIRDIYSLNKNSWMATREMMTDWQKQSEKMWNILLDQGVVAQQEGKKMLQEWLNKTKQAQEQYNKSMEDAWKKTEAVLGANPKAGK